jgi:hypothetical protein
MKKRNFVILVCLAAALLAIAVISSKRGQTRTHASSRSQLLFKDLPVNDVTSITITAPDGELKLQRADKGWIVPSKFGYPVDFDKIKKALLALAELKAGDQRNLNDAQINKVRMVSPLDEKAPQSSKGSLVRVYTSTEEPVASLLIGAEKAPRPQSPRGTPGSRYVSVDGGKTILLTGQSVSSLESTDTSSWLANDIVSVNTFSITNIAISVFDEKPLSLHTDDSGKLTMDKLSRRKKVDEAKAQSVRYTLSYLRYDDIADPQLDDKALGFDKPSTFTVATTQGEIYTATLGGSPEGSESRYIRVAAQFLAAPNKESKDAEQEELEKAKKRVETVNARCKDWTYLVTPAKFNTMLYTRKDLVAKKEKDD